MKKSYKEALENSEVHKPLEIHFGDEFIPVHNSNKHMVIIDVGGEDMGFEAMTVVSKQGTEALGGGGSTSRQDVKEIIGRWPLERIMNGIMVYWGHEKPEGELYNSIRQLAAKDPRVII